MSTLSDIIVNALQEFLTLLLEPISSLIGKFSDTLIRILTSTPHPDAVFNPPTNEAWPNIYDFYWDAIIPLSLFLWALSIGLVIFLQSMGHLFSGYHRSQLKRRSVAGLLGILSWWWIAALSLRFVDSLTGFIVPNLAEISLFQTVSFGAIGLLGLALSLTIDLALFAILALLYFSRQLALYLFVLLMPILIALWIPGVGPFAGASKFMEKLSGFYVPMLFMTVPVAILFRLGELLGSSFEISMEGFGAWLTALVIPLFAVVSPIILIWQAGNLFSTTDRLSRHSNHSRAPQRVAKSRERTAVVHHRGAEFTRGARGEPSQDRNNQTLLVSGTRAHAAGATVRQAGRSLRTRFEAVRSSTRVTDETAPTPDGGRNTDFDTLRSRGDNRPQRATPPAEDRDRPWYID